MLYPFTSRIKALLLMPPWSLDNHKPGPYWLKPPNPHTCPQPRTQHSYLGTP